MDIVNKINKFLNESLTDDLNGDGGREATRIIQNIQWAREELHKAKTPEQKKEHHDYIEKEIRYCRSIFGKIGFSFSPQQKKWLRDHKVI